MTPESFAILLLVGIFSGTVGTIAGLGGGFMVVPILRLVFGVAPATVAGVSLVIVVANAVSGSFAYLRQGRADVRAALLVAVTALPASLLGVYLVRGTPVASFDLLYGALLVYFFIDIVRRVRRRLPAEPLRLPGLRDRVLVDAGGQTFHYVTNAPLILLCGVGFGFVSSFFGIGGGIVFLMFFIPIFRMPTHVVTATATLAMVMVSPVGLLLHAVARDVDWILAAPLAIGGLLGGQLGPHLARRMSSSRLMTVIACMLLVAAAALVAKHLPH